MVPVAAPVERPDQFAPAALDRGAMRAAEESVHDPATVLAAELEEQRRRLRHFFPPGAFAAGASVPAGFVAPLAPSLASFCFAPLEAL